MGWSNPYEVPEYLIADKFTMTSLLLIPGTVHEMLQTKKRMKSSSREGICCVLTPAGNKAPHSCSLTYPQWDGGANQKSKSEKIHVLR